MACHTYHDNANRLPSFYDGSGDGGFVKEQLFISLLPYLEKEALFSSPIAQGGFESLSYTPPPPHAGPAINISGSDKWNQYQTAFQARNTKVKLFRCWSDASYAKGNPVNGSYAAGSYAANFLIFGDPYVVIMDPTRRPPRPLAKQATFRSKGKTKLMNITDGTSSTIMFTEKVAACHINGEVALDGSSEGQNCWVLGLWTSPPLNAKPPTAAFPPVIAYGKPGLGDTASPFKVGDGLPFPQKGRVGPDDAMFQVITNEDDVADCGRPSSPHHGGIHCAMADGSVHFFGDTINPVDWWRFLTVRQGDVPSFIP